MSTIFFWQSLESVFELSFKFLFNQNITISHGFYLTLGFLSYGKFPLKTEILTLFKTPFGFRESATPGFLWLVLWVSCKRSRNQLIKRDMVNGSVARCYNIVPRYSGNFRKWNANSFTLKSPKIKEINVSPSIKFRCWKPRQKCQM